MLHCQTMREGTPLTLPPMRRCSTMPSRVPPPAVVAAAGDAPKEQSGLAKTLGLGFLFALWYAFNIQFNM